MDPISAASTGTLPTTHSATSRGMDSLKSEDFFKLLITELRSQDPLKPSDTNQLVQEMSTIRQMESSTQLSTALTSLSDQQRFGATTSLLGKFVRGTKGSGGAGATVEGIVVSVRFSPSGDATLELHTGDELALKNVTDVTFVDPASLPTTPSGTTTPTAPARSKQQPSLVDLLFPFTSQQTRLSA